MIAQLFLTAGASLLAAALIIVTVDALITIQVAIETHTDCRPQLRWRMRWWLNVMRWWLNDVRFNVNMWLINRKVGF